MQKDKRLFMVGILGAVGVALGALGAHYLKGKIASGMITPDQLNGFDTAVKYQMYHTIAMLMMLVLIKQEGNKFFSAAFALFFWGIILFSGSLYFLCTRNLLGAEWLKFLGPVTPLGGILFISGWLCLCLAVLKKDKNISAS